MPSTALPHSEQILLSLAYRSGLAVEGDGLTEAQRTFAEAIAGYCARIGDGYGRGTGDATAGEHIRSEFNI